jgi:protein-S-isoprenylcysteine O-methyltransferase Ste14
MLLKRLLGVLAGTAFLAALGAVLFGCAGRWDLPFFWAYLGLLEASLVASGLLADPGLARERLRPGPGGKDYVTVVVFLPLWLGSFVVAGLDVGRFHWSDSVPPALQAVGLVLFAAAIVVETWAVAVNRFFSSVVRIQRDRGHHVITTGPYRYVRHPGYAGALLLFLGGGLTLGSWLALLLNLAMIPAMIRRTVIEDRSLRHELEGYASYAEKVRYRLIPGVW